MQTVEPYQFRKVKTVDNNLASDCYYIAGEFMGDAESLVYSIPYDVNTLGRPMFVAEKANGYLLGFVVGQVQDAKNARITSLYVTARAHRKGIASHLLADIEQYFRERGITRVSLDSRPMAVHFYNARGYSRVAQNSHRLQKTL